MLKGFLENRAPKNEPKPPVVGTIVPIGTIQPTEEYSALFVTKASRDFSSMSMRRQYTPVFLIIVMQSP